MAWLDSHVHLISTGCRAAPGPVVPLAISIPGQDWSVEFLDRHFNGMHYITICLPLPLGQWGRRRRREMAETRGIHYSMCFRFRCRALHLALQHAVRRRGRLGSVGLGFVG